MKRNITSLAYGAAVSDIFEIPSRGKSTKGIMATAGMGIASVIHQEIINAATANTRFADTYTFNGLKNSMNKNNNGPIKNETVEPICEYLSAFTYIIFMKIYFSLKS